MKNKLKNFKNKFSLFLSFLFLFQLISFNSNNTAFAATTPSVSYTVTGETKIGNTIEIAVNISNVTDLYGGSIDFVYDTSLLEIQSVAKGNIFGSNTVLTPLGSNGKVENGQSSFSISLKGDKPGVNGSGTLAIIKAKVLKEGTVKLNTTNSNTPALSLGGDTLRVKLSDSKVKNIDYTSINSYIELNQQSTAVLTNGAYQENNNAFIYTGDWNTRSSLDYDSGALKISASNDSSVEFKFNGNSFEWYGTKASNRGIAKVYIDGKEVKSVDAFSYSTAFKQLLYKSDTLAPGIHTVKIAITGSKNPASSNPQVDLDKIIIKNEVTTLTPGTYQEDNNAFIYTGDWNTRSSLDYDSGALKISASNDSSVEFKFNGNSFEWYGTKASNRGIAKVYIDGKEVKSVDAFSYSTAFKQLLYKSDTLAPGIHTVKIAITGSKNPASSNPQVDLDKIIIK